MSRWFARNYPRRFPVAIDGSATVTGSVDATIALTGLAAEFWATIQADGDDVRVCDAAGTTRIAYDLESFNYSAKTVTIELDNLTHHTTNTITVVWVYFGDADATNLEDGITPSSPLTGYTLFTGPGAEPVYDLGSPAGAATPTQRRQKRSTESLFLWFRVGPFGELAYPYEESGLPPEGPQSLSVSAAAIAGDAGTVTANTSAIRLFQASNGEVFARVTLSGGTTDNEYDLVLTVVTTEGRTLNGVVRVAVQD